MTSDPFALTLLWAFITFVAGWALYDLWQYLYGKGGQR